MVYAVLDTENSGIYFQAVGLPLPYSQKFGLQERYLQLCVISGMDAFLGISAWVPLIQVDPSLSMHPKPCSFDSIDFPASWRESSWALSCILCSSGWVPVLDHPKDEKDPMRRWNAEEHRPCYTNVNSTNKRIKMKSDNKKTGCCGWPDQKHPTTRYVHLNQGNGAVAHCVGGGCGGAQDKNIKQHWCLCGVSPCYGVTQNTSLLMTKVCFKTWKQTSIVCSIRHVSAHDSLARASCQM